MKRTVTVGEDSRHSPGSVSVERMEKHLWLSVERLDEDGGATSETYKTMDHSDAESLRDALIELYPVEQKQPEPKVRYESAWTDAGRCEIYRIDPLVTERKTLVTTTSFREDEAMILEAYRRRAAGE